MSNTQRILFTLNISPDDYLVYYTGAVKSVLAKAKDGRVVKFPASVLQQFLTYDGIHGSFEMEIDENNKFLNIRRIDRKNDDGIWL